MQKYSIRTDNKNKITNSQSYSVDALEFIAPRKKYQQ